MRSQILELNGLVDESVRRSQNAWINLLCKLTETTVVGIEYNYSRLDVTDLRNGDNSRIQVTMRVAK